MHFVGRHLLSVLENVEYGLFPYQKFIFKIQLCFMSCILYVSFRIVIQHFLLAAGQILKLCFVMVHVVSSLDIMFGLVGFQACFDACIVLKITIHIIPLHNPFTPACARENECM